jgi:hypothetical protein
VSHREKLFENRDTVYAVDFGVRVGVGIDNEAALTRIQEYCQSTDRLVKVVLPPGRIESSYNAWCSNLGKGGVYLQGNGTSIQSTYDGSWSIPSHPMFIANWIYPDMRKTQYQSSSGGYVQQGSGGTWPYLGYRFSGATVGDLSVTLSTQAEESNFQVGDIVCLNGQDAQSGGGFPPNMHTFEYNRIVSISSGVLTLAQPIRYLYDDNWREFSSGYEVRGKPRICPTRRAYNDVTHYFGVEGVEFLDHPSGSDPVCHAGALVNEIIGCTGEQTYVPPNMHTIHRGCSFRIVEPDKMVDRLEFEDCHIQLRETTTGESSTFRGLVVSQATGVNHVSFKRCTIQQINDCTPKSMTFDDCVFIVPSTDYPVIRMTNNRTVDFLSVNRSKFYWPDDYYRFPIELGFDVESFTTAPSGNGVRTLVYSAANFEGQAKIGSIVYTSSGMARIVAIACDGTNYTCTTDRLTFTDSQSVWYLPVTRFDLGDDNELIGPKSNRQSLCHLQSYSPPLRGEKRTFVIDRSNRMLDRNGSVSDTIYPMYVTKITLDQPTAAASGSYLQFRFTGENGQLGTVRFDTSIVHTVTIDSSGVNRWL